MTLRRVLHDNGKVCLIIKYLFEPESNTVHFQHCVVEQHPSGACAMYEAQAPDDCC